MSTHLTTTRRHFLLMSSVAAAALSSPFRASAATALDRAKLAEEAAIWGFTLVMTGRYLKYAAEKKVPFNQFYVNHVRPKPDAYVAGPNPDMLYGMVWIDLSAEPQVLEVPDTHGHYYAIQLMDAYQSTFMFVGRRETGTKTGAYALTGPNWSGSLPAGVVQIKAPTNLVVAVSRTLAKDDKDVVVAREIQGQYSLGPLSAYPKGRVLPATRDDTLLFPLLDLSNAGAGFFDELGALLKKYPPTPADAARLARFAPLGVGPGLTPSHDSGLAPVLAAGVSSAMKHFDVDAFVTDAGGGWRTNTFVDHYNFDEPFMRAWVNFGGPAWLMSQEALYFAGTTGSDGQPLTGAKRYKISFPSGQLPPVNEFWSITVYDPGWHLVDNPIKRYDIASFTQGLVSNADGSLDIFVQHEPPANGSSNWLPTPKGPFRLHGRAYGPRAPLLYVIYKWPAVQVV